MASDGEAWKRQDQALLAILLRIGQDQIVTQQQTLSGNVRLYFYEILVRWELVLDPDTGFKTGYVKDIRQYVKPEEFHSLLRQDNNRVIAVYQHIRHKLTRDRIEGILEVLGSRSIASSVLSMNQEPSLFPHFDDFLGSHANNRIGRWQGL